MVARPVMGHAALDAYLPRHFSSDRHARAETDVTDDRDDTSVVPNPFRDAALRAAGVAAASECHSHHWLDQANACVDAILTELAVWDD